MGPLLVVVSSVFAGFFAVVIAIMNFIAILIMTQVANTSFSFEAIKVVGLSFIQSFIYLMFALLLATFFRRSGIAIIVFFIYGLLLESLFMWLLSNISPAAQYFLPLQVADSLIPFIRFKEMYKSMPSEMVMLIGAIAYAGLYIYMTVRKYKYDDLKQLIPTLYLGWTDFIATFAAL